MKSQISHYVINPFDIMYRQWTSRCFTHSIKRDLLQSLHFSIFLFTGEVCVVSHSQPMPIMPLIFITIHPLKLCSALFLPWVFLFYYTSVTLFSSPSQIPRCPFNTCPSRCSSSPVFIIFLCCTHTIPVVVSLSFTPHPLTHTKTLQVVPCLFISTSRWLDLL